MVGELTHICIWKAVQEAKRTYMAVFPTLVLLSGFACGLIRRDLQRNLSQLLLCLGAGLFDLQIDTISNRYYVPLGTPH